MSDNIGRNCFCGHFGIISAFYGIYLNKYVGQNNCWKVILQIVNRLFLMIDLYTLKPGIVSSDIFVEINPQKLEKHTKCPQKEVLPALSTIFVDI